MLNARLIASLKPGATFINTARGGLVDQDALLAWIQHGDLYAVLDVTMPWELCGGDPQDGPGGIVEISPARRATGPDCLRRDPPSYID